VEGKRLVSIFQDLDIDSCPLHYNFHLHTVHSDGQLTPLQVIEQAVKIGLQGFALTDHHSVGGYWVVKEWLQSQRWQMGKPLKVPRLWTGVEITAELLGTDVHILGYAFDPDHISLRPYLQGRTVKGSAFRSEAVIEAIHEAGGLAILAHPMRYRVPAEALVEEAVSFHIDGVEAFYAYDNPSPWRSSPDRTKTVLALAQRHQLLTTGGTDTHGTNILQRI
jgi:predicted metal-dependent phosphoesterase TrpH